MHKFVRATHLHSRARRGEVAVSGYFAESDDGFVAKLVFHDEVRGAALQDQLLLS
jgi:hypothetical protein